MRPLTGSSQPGMHALSYTDSIQHYTYDMTLHYTTLVSVHYLWPSVKHISPKDSINLSDRVIVPPQGISGNSGWLFRAC